MADEPFWEISGPRRYLNIPTPVPAYLYSKFGPRDPRDDTELERIAHHDPSMIRDVAAAYMSTKPL